MRCIIVMIVLFITNLQTLEAFHHVKVTSNEFDGFNSLSASMNEHPGRSKRIEKQNSKIFFVKIAPPTLYSSSSNNIENLQNFDRNLLRIADSLPSQRRSDLSITQVFTPHLLRNSDLYKLPLKFVSNARPILIKGIRTALAPRAEEQPPKKFSSLKPTKLNKNVYRYLTESKFIREGASRIIHLPTKFLSNAQPRRAVLLKNPFSEPSPKDLFITERNNVHRRLAPEYSGDNLPNSQPIAGIKGITIKTKTGKKFPGNNNNSGVRKLASPAMIAKYGLKHKQLI